MIDNLKKLFLRFNYTDEKGFILNVPSLNNREHLTLGFDNKRKEFNIHFTNENINEPGAKRREFIFAMSAFRFFLFLKRFEVFYNQSIVNLILSSKTNLGKLKKHKLIINTFTDSVDFEEKIIYQKRKGKGRPWRFRENFDWNLIADNFKYLEKSDLNSDKAAQAFSTETPIFLAAIIAASALKALCSPITGQETFPTSFPLLIMEKSR